MSKRLVATSTLVVGILVCVVIAGDEPSETSKSPVGGQGNRQATAEAEIRQAAAGFVTAFNRGDAKAVAAHWTEDGDYVNEYGQKYHGREAIDKEYKKFFTAYPGVKIRLQIDSLRTMDENNAIEDGHATLDPQPQGTALPDMQEVLLKRKK